MPNPDRFCRVLIVGATALSADDATAITLRSLFEDWPEAKLMQICASVPAIKEGSKRIRYIPTQRKLALSRKPKLGLGQVIGAGEENASLIKQAYFKLRTTLRAVGDSFLRPPIAHVKANIGIFAPEIIYALGGSISWTRLAADLADVANCPVVFHFMDDWPGTLYRDAYGSAVWRFFVERSLENALKHSKTHFTIGTDMAREYQSRYGHKFLPFMRCIEPSLPAKEYLSENSGDLKLVYCGGLHLGRWRLLRDIGQAIQARPDCAISLTIFAPASHLNEIREVFCSFPSIIIGGTLDPAFEQSILSLYDVAVHVESFEPRPAAYTRLSISAKIPLYFSIPLPILAIGPQNLSSIRWIASTGAGVVVDSQDKHKLDQALDLLKQKQQRKKMAEAGYSKYLSSHNAFLVRNIFAESLNTIIKEKQLGRLA